MGLIPLKNFKSKFKFKRPKCLQKFSPKSSPIPIFIYFLHLPRQLRRCHLSFPPSSLFSSSFSSFLSELLTLPMQARQPGLIFLTLAILEHISGHWNRQLLLHLPLSSDTWKGNDMMSKSDEEVSGLIIPSELFSATFWS